MKITTERLLLRPWEDSDAVNLYQYAKDPQVGPRAGWPPHESQAQSLAIIQTVVA
ncbi:GNAT family N-acetyltransferase [Enterococcus cecorum]